MGVMVLVEYVFHSLSAFSSKIAAANRTLTKETDGKWFGPFFTASVMALIIFLWTYGLNEDSEDGYLAEHFKIMANLQNELGIANKHLAEISEHTKKSASHLESMDRKLDTLKKERSDDPRKQLANMGISWNEENYFKAIRDADIVALQLFWQGGMDPMARKQVAFEFGKIIPFTSSIPYVFLALNPKNTNWRSLFDTYLENGFFKLNEKAFDYYSFEQSTEDFIARLDMDALLAMINRRCSPAELIAWNCMNNSSTDKDLVEALGYMLARGANFDFIGYPEGLLLKSIQNAFNEGRIPLKLVPVMKAVVEAESATIKEFKLIMEKAAQSGSLQPIASPENGMGAKWINKIWQFKDTLGR